jgi:hypothetical protein
VHEGEIKISSESSFSASGDKVWIISDLPVASAHEWFKEAVDRLKSAADCPQTITEAGHWIAREMEAAFRRRQVDASWNSKSITNKLRDLEYWKRARPKKG